MCVVRAQLGRAFLPRNDLSTETQKRSQRIAGQSFLPDSCLSKAGKKQILCLSSVSKFSHTIVSTSLRPHGLQHPRLLCPSPTPKACSNPCPLSRVCHPTISSSVVPFSSCLPSFPASGFFPVSQFFVSGGQSIGASASVLPINIQD